MQLLVMEKNVREAFESRFACRCWGAKNKWFIPCRPVLLLKDSSRSSRSMLSSCYFGFFCNLNHMFYCLIMEPGSTWGRMEKKGMANPEH
jgi:hypothetical protein